MISRTDSYYKINKLRSLRWSYAVFYSILQTSIFASTEVHANSVNISMPLKESAANIEVNSSQGRDPFSIAEVYKDLYVLGPGDRLQLSFLDPAVSKIGGPIEILPDGTSTLVLIGSVQLTGLTIGQATAWLTTLYSEQLVRPELILSLSTPRPAKVTILGEVGRPGLYPLPSFSTPVSAIQSAGGITLNSDIRTILLRRRAGPDGSQKQTTLDLAQLMKFGNQRQNPILFDGDTIIVGRLENPLPEEILELGLSNLAPTSISVTVIGEVKRPGIIALPANTPLAEAVFRAGGTINWKANQNKISLVRLNRDGSTFRKDYSMKNDENVSNDLNPPLRDRDTVIVNPTIYGRALSLLNQVSEPLNLYLQYDRVFRRIN